MRAAALAVAARQDFRAVVVDLESFFSRGNCRSVATQRSLSALVELLARQALLAVMVAIAHSAR